LSCEDGDASAQMRSAVDEAMRQQLRA